MAENNNANNSNINDYKTLGDVNIARGKALEKTGDTIDKIAKAYSDYQENKENILNGKQLPSLIETSNADENETSSGESEQDFTSKIKTSLENTQDDKVKKDESTKTSLKEDNQNVINAKTQIKTSINNIDTQELNQNEIVTNENSRIATSTNKLDTNTQNNVNGNADSNTNQTKVKEKNTILNKINNRYFNKNQGKGSKLISSTGIATKTVGKGFKKISRKQKQMANMQERDIVQNLKKTYSEPIRRVTVKTTSKVMKMTIKFVAMLLKKAILILGGFFLATAPLFVIGAIIAGTLSIFGMSSTDSEKAIKNYEEYIVETTNNYRSDVSQFEQKDEDNEINGISMIDWKTPLSIIQTIGSDLEYDDAEKNLLEEWKNADLYEKHTITQKEIDKEVEYEETIQKEDGTTETVKKTRIEKKTIEVLTITNASYDDYMEWCTNNKDKIVAFKEAKKVSSKNEDGSISQDDKDIIKNLMSSEYFFDFASDSFKASITDNGNGTVVEGSSEIGNKIANLALSRRGYAYVWGGCHAMEQIKDPNWTKFDCSGLVNWAYYQAGASVGSNTTTTLLQKGRTITYEEMQPGDIILYINSSGVHHVAIYIGNGKMVHAPRTGDVVKIGEARWNSETMVYKRLLNY